MGKVFRGRRTGSFLADFLVVMLGVLVALALEQFLSNWQEKQRVQSAVAALEQELADFKLVLGVRMEVSACIVDKLAELEAQLQAADADPRRMHNLGQPPYYFSSRGGWNDSAAGLVARHLGADTAMAYGELYQGLQEFGTLAHREQAYWATLDSLGAQVPEIEPQTRWRMLEAVAGARGANRLLTAIAEQMLARIDGLVDLPDADLPDGLEQRPICLPLEAA